MGEAKTWDAFPTRGETRDRVVLGVPYGDRSRLPTTVLPASCMRTLLCSFRGSTSIGVLAFAGLQVERLPAAPRALASSLKGRKDGLWLRQMLVRIKDEGAVH